MSSDGIRMGARREDRHDQLDKEVHQQVGFNSSRDRIGGRRIGITARDRDIVGGNASDSDGARRYGVQ
jgi:hypothetical protein